MARRSLVLVAVLAAASYVNGAHTSKGFLRAAAPAFVSPSPSLARTRAASAISLSGSAAIRQRLGRTAETHRNPSAVSIVMCSSEDPAGVLEHLKRVALPAVAAFALLTGLPCAAPAELTPEQKVVAQAWMVVDATYVDRTFNNNDWFKLRQSLVKRRYFLACQCGNLLKYCGACCMPSPCKLIPFIVTLSRSFSYSHDSNEELHQDRQDADVVASRNVSSDTGFGKRSFQLCNEGRGIHSHSGRDAEAVGGCVHTIHHSYEV